MNHHHYPARQDGAVLVVSLILLVALTLLGMSVMNTSQLEERMASNTQELTQSFQSAETGLSQAYDNDDAWDPVNNYEKKDTTIASGLGRHDKVSYEVQHLVDTNPPSGYDVVQFRAAHFDFRSTGTSQSNLSTIVHGGGSQVMHRDAN